jgi:tRNA modification GTPase
MATTSDSIEAAAQGAGGRQRRQATVEIACIDAATARDELIGESVGRVGDDGLVVLTKSDLGVALALDRTTAAARSLELLPCSSATGHGIGDLVDQLRTRLNRGRAGETSAVATTASRCAGSLQRADVALGAALALVSAGAEELIAAEIRAALDAIGEVVGAVCSDDILDRIFSQFCIGK